MSNHVWSYTSLDTFDKCPKKFYHRYILNEKDEPTPALIKGREIHKICENYLKGEGEARLEKGNNLLQSVKAMKQPGIKQMVELKMGLTRDLQPCGFFDKNVWGRSAADVITIKYPNAFIGDWKDGKGDKPWSYVLKYESPVQHAIMAAFVFKHFPKVEEITGVNLWLEHEKMGPVRKFTRAMEPALWTAILQKVIAVEEAIAQNKFCMVPGPLCGYCPVISCPNNPKGGYNG